MFEASLGYSKVLSQKLKNPAEAAKMAQWLGIHMALASAYSLVPSKPSKWLTHL